MKIDKILVPLDGSTLAEAALTTACDFAARDGAAISLLRAADATSLLGADVVEAQVTDRAPVDVPRGAGQATVASRV